MSGLFGVVEDQDPLAGWQSDPATQTGHRRDPPPGGIRHRDDHRAPAPPGEVITAVSPRIESDSGDEARRTTPYRLMASTGQ
jgi:hypothetical protein